MRSKNAIVNILSSLLLQFVTIICGFIIPKLIISSYGSMVNGLVNSITQFLAYITLLEAGMGPVVRSLLYKPISEKDVDKIEKILKSTEKFFRKLAIIFCIYLIILCGIYPVLLKNDFEILYVISLILIIAISTFAEYFFGITYRIYIQANQKTYIVSVIQIITTILNAVFLIILVNINASIQIVKLVSSLIFVVRPILQNIYVRKKYKINLNNTDSSNYVIEKRWDGLAQHVAAVIHANTDVAILTFFSTLEEVSVYSVYILVVNGVKKVISSFTSGIDALFGDMIAKNEQKNMSEKFRLYETCFFNVITIIFGCTIVLLIPFIEIYTQGIKDVNYIRPLFGYILVLAEFIYSLRLPYNYLVMSAGHFKETKKGAWFEAIINLILSMILVNKYGIIGVAIGTIIAMTIRTIEIIIYCTKNILLGSNKKLLKRILLIIIQVILCVLINTGIKGYKDINTYCDWVIYGGIVFIVSSIIVLLINFIFYRNDYVEIFERIEKMFKREK